MKLTKKEISEISRLYRIGSFKEKKSIPGGMINYNYSVKTDKGKFIVKRLGYKQNSWIMKKKDLEFGVIEYLRKNKFPYQVPEFLKNCNGNYVSKIGKFLFEVHPRIKGIKRVNLTNKQFKEMVKALAIYHKIVKKYPLEKKHCWVNDNKWMLEKFVELRRVKAKNKVDKLMLKHLDKYEETLKKVLGINIREDCLAAHSDFHVYNILWKKDRVVGLLDFENITCRPKLHDIANIWRGDKRKKMLVDTYRKYNKLSKREENNLIILKLIANCNMFWWSYLGMKKRPELKYKWIQRTIKNGKKYHDLWRKQK